MMRRFYFVLPLLIASAVIAAEPYSPQTKKGVDAYNQAVGHLDESQPKPAAAKLAKCLKAEPKRGMCQTLLAKAWTRMGKSEDAVALLQEVTAAHPTQLRPLVTLSHAYFLLQRFDESAASSQKALNLDPISLLALGAHQNILLRMGRYDDMLAALEAARAVAKKPEHDCLEAQVRLQRDNAQAARALLTSCRTAEDPSFIANAEAAFTAATGEHTAGSKALVGLLDEESPLTKAISAFNERDYKGAEEEATKAIAEPNSESQGRVIRALARQEMGRTAEALKDLDAAVGAGTWIDVHRSGVVSGILTKKSEERFLAHLRRGAALRVRLLAEEGRVEDSAAALDAALEAFGDDPALQAANVWLLIKQEKPAEAWDAATRSLSADPAPNAAQQAASMLALNHLDASSPENLAVVAERGTVPTRFNLAAGLSNRQRPVECSDVLAPLVGTEDTIAARAGDDRATQNDLRALQAQTNLLGHACALTAGNVDAAVELWSLLGDPEAVQEWNVLNHALLLLQAERSAESWATLESTKILERGGVQNVALSLQIAIGASIGLKEWTRTVALSERPDTPDSTRLMAGTELGTAGQKKLALSILQPLCANLKGEQKAICSNNVKVFSQ
jgi:tetratricopeptide (TPR) repeat protein